MQVNLILLSLVLLVFDLHADESSDAAHNKTPKSLQAISTANDPNSSVQKLLSSTKTQIDNQPTAVHISGTISNSVTASTSADSVSVDRNRLDSSNTELSNVKLDNVVGQARKSILKSRPAGSINADYRTGVLAPQSTEALHVSNVEPTPIAQNVQSSRTAEKMSPSVRTAIADSTGISQGLSNPKPVNRSVSTAPLNAAKSVPISVVKASDIKPTADVSTTKKPSRTLAPKPESKRLVKASKPINENATAVVAPPHTNRVAVKNSPQSHPQRIANIATAKSLATDKINASKVAVAELPRKPNTANADAVVSSVASKPVASQASKAVAQVDLKSVSNKPTKVAGRNDIKSSATKKTKVVANAVAKTVASDSSSIPASVISKPVAKTNAKTEGNVLTNVAIKSPTKTETQPKPVKLPKLVTVKEVKYSKNPTFQSTIRPVIRSSVVTPARGKIVHVNKIYGDHVKKDDLIISVSSNEAKKELMSNVVDFIQSKDSYYESLATLRKNIELQKKGVISKQELNSSQSSYISSLISMVRTRIEFKKLAQSLDFDWRKVDDLDFSKQPLLQQKGGAEDIVEFLLNKQYILKIDAGESGIFLPKITQDDDQEQINFVAGGTVKEDQVIGMIADPKRLRLRIEVPEFDVLKFSKGQTAVMKIPVLKNKTMQGEISEIRRFEYNQRSGQIPTIPVTVDIACKENCERYYSISAEVSIINPAEPTLQVPLTAVGKSDDSSQQPIHYVKILVDGKITKKRVTVGSTTANSIVILSGLSKGDQIVENYKNPES